MDVDDCDDYWKVAVLGVVDMAKYLKFSIAIFKAFIIIFVILVVSIIVQGCTNGQCKGVMPTEHVQKHCFLLSEQADVTTLNIIFSVTNYTCLAQIFILNCTFGVTNTKCKPSIISHSF